MSWFQRQTLPDLMEKMARRARGQTTMTTEVVPLVRLEISGLTQRRAGEKQPRGT
jgi:hypothetical protein